MGLQNKLKNMLEIEMPVEGYPHDSQMIASVNKYPELNRYSMHYIVAVFIKKLT